MNSKNSIAVPVQFNGDTLYCIQVEQRPFIIVKYVADAIGMDSDYALQSIKNDSELASELQLVPIQIGTNKTRHLAVIPIEYVQGWLFSLQVSRVSETYRDKLRDYKKQCYRILYSYFNGHTNTILNNAQEMHILREELKVHNTAISTIKKRLTELTESNAAIYNQQQTRLALE